MDTVTDTDKFASRVLPQKFQNFRLHFRLTAFQMMWW